MRLDKYLVLHFGFTRNKAQYLIESGLIRVGGKLIQKASYDVDTEVIEVLEDRRVEWVSRSAMKLAGFLEQHQDISVSETCCLDVGSSTGGFTQVLLEQGALHVDAVDVGTNQLHDSLRLDPRVRSYEQTDIREFSSESPYDIIVCDASFISLTVLFPAILLLAQRETQMILLYKPQFEVGSENLRKTGVPKDEMVVAKKMKAWEDFVLSHDCSILAKEKSSLIGEAGNQEWVYWIRKRSSSVA